MTPGSNGSQNGVVAMIPARAGSRGLPGKNTLLLGGKPLIAHSIEAALHCPGIEMVYVNSDDPKCLELGRSLGARLYQRSAEFASDTATMQSVTQDFARGLRREGLNFAAVIVLYPTFPLRTAQDLSAILAEFWKEGGTRPLLSVKASSRSHPYGFYTVDENRHPRPFCGIDLNTFYRRQDYPPAYELKHYACVIPFDQVEGLNAQMQNEKTFVMSIAAEKLVDIDTSEDLELAERSMAKLAAAR